MSNKNLSLFKKAQREKWAIGQFNISNLETLRAILEAAFKLKSPVIIGTSERESKFIGLRQAAGLVRAWREETGLPVILNLDHGKTFGYIKEAVEAGYDAVHFDGSELPLAKNIEITKRIKDFSHKKGVLVEAEIDSIKGASKLLKKAPKIKKEDLTDPREARDFAVKTKVDLLAVSLGSFHGVAKNSQLEKIDLKRLKEIKKSLGNTPLVLHGGSGLAENEIKEAIKLGIVKINVNTELRMAYTNTLKKILKKMRSETTPYKYFPEVIKKVQAVVEEKIKLFGSVNKAEKI